MLAALIIAATIYSEAAGEGPAGRVAVAGTIVTRAQDRRLTPAQVCRQRKQFSCWNGVDDKRMATRLKGWAAKSPVVWRHCIELATAIEAGRVKANGYSHYYNPSKASPSWGPKLKDRRRIGNHIFGKLEK